MKIARKNGCKGGNPSCSVYLSCGVCLNPEGNMNNGSFPGTYKDYTIFSVEDFLNYYEGQS